MRGGKGWGGGGEGEGEGGGELRWGWAHTLMAAPNLDSMYSSIIAVYSLKSVVYTSLFSSPSSNSSQCFEVNAPTRALKSSSIISVSSSASIWLNVSSDELSLVAKTSSVPPKSSSSPSRGGPSTMSSPKSSESSMPPRDAATGAAASLVAPDEPAMPRTLN